MGSDMETSELQELGGLSDTNSDDSGSGGDDARALEKPAKLTPADVESDLRAALRAAIRAFGYAFGAKALASVLLAVRKLGPVRALRLLAETDSLRFGAFLASLVGVYRVSEVAARVLRGKNDETNLAIAGGLAGLTLLVDSPERRATVALYLFTRMLDVVGRRLTASGAMPAWKYSTEALFALSNSAILYSFFIQPAAMTKSYYNWVLSAGGLTHHGLQYTIRERLHDIVDASGAPIAFRACQPHYHTESCARHGVSEWIRGLGRSARMYFPVHFLPALVFKLQRLRAAPLAFTTTLSLAALRSSVFLTSYQALGQMVVCAIRNTFQRDFHMSGWLAGFATGATLFVESPKRRSELMLYCLTRALDIVWQLLKRRELVRYVKHSEVALFSLSLAAIMSSPPQHFKPTYLSVLRFVFGQHAI